MAKKNPVIRFTTEITTYWWNCGTKTKDFTGTIDEFFEKWKIKWRYSKDKKFTVFNIKVGSQSIVYKAPMTNSDRFTGLTVVQVFLTMLGDRAQIRFGTSNSKIDINN